MRKIILILFLLLISIILILAYTNNKKIHQTANLIDQNFIETKKIREELIKKYPDSDISVWVNFGKNLAPGSYSTASSKLSVNIQSNRLFGSSEIKEINGIICEILDTLGQKYDIVETRSTRVSFLPLKQFPVLDFAIHIEVGGYCNEFMSE